MVRNGGGQVIAPQTPGTPPPPQVKPPVQLQFSAPPQLSPIMPQYCTPFGPLQVLGTQPGSMHTPLLLQLKPVGHMPQSSARPQPSPILPQLRTPVVGQGAGMH